ncbi:MAG: glycosyltransferase, partial [Hyphomicrobiaceae bacterium]
VSTRNRGAVEVVGEGDAGRLAPLGDAEGLANAVSALLTDDELRARTIAAATARIHGRYDPLSLAGAWVDMLIEAAERQPIARGQP